MTLTYLWRHELAAPNHHLESLKRPESSLRLMVQYHNQISFSHFLLSPLCHALISVLHIFSHTFLPYFLSKSSLLSVSKLSSTVTMKHNNKDLNFYCENLKFHAVFICTVLFVSFKPHLDGTILTSEGSSLRDRWKKPWPQLSAVRRELTGRC